jgi:gamma-glutamyltranspeptidase/glutathione hydrolase
LGNGGSPIGRTPSETSALWRQWGAIACLAAWLGGCGGSVSDWIASGSDPSFPGGVAGDEPRAVLIGREVLGIGGSAGDAAVAMAFALTATLPSRASLGGGGVCLVHEPKAMKTEALEFLPRAPEVPASTGAPRIAVPGLPRGMFALHARLGRLRWEETVSPAERLARFGVDATRAFARDLPGATDMISRDAQARAIFADGDGTPVTMGGRLRNLDLAGQLGRIRAEGVGAFYAGTGAQAFVSGVRALGGTVSMENLRDYRPNWQPTVKAKVGDHVGHFAPQAIGGLVAAELWTILGQGPDTTAGVTSPPLPHRGRRPMADDRRDLSSSTETAARWPVRSPPGDCSGSGASYPRPASSPPRCRIRQASGRSHP